MLQPKSWFEADWTSSFFFFALRTAQSAIFGIMGCFGLCGCVFVILSFFLFPKLRSFNKTLVLCLAIADALSAVADILSLGYFASHRHPPVYCTIQAVVIQYAELASFIWSLIIAAYLYASAVHNLLEKKAKAFLPLLVCVGFILPSLPIPFLLLKNTMGNSINGSEITWYVPLNSPNQGLKLNRPKSVPLPVCLALYPSISELRR